MSGIKKMYTFYTELTSTEANATPTLMSADAGIKFAIFLTNGSKPVSLENIKRLHASFTKPNSPTPYVQDLDTGVSIQDAEKGIIAIDVDAAAFSGSAGIVQLDLMLYDETQGAPIISVTGRIQLNVRLPIENNGSMLKNPHIPLLIALQEDLEAALEKQGGQIDETRIAINEANTMAQYASDQGDFAKFHGEQAQVWGQLNVSAVNIGSEQAAFAQLSLPNKTLVFGIPRGLEGQQGIQGIQGEQGNKGERGDQGEQGVQGEQGNQGIQGEQGNTGARGDQGAQGVEGVQGIKGEKGDGGEKGDRGSDGVISTASGMYAFSIDSTGDLILHYFEDDPQPDFSLNESGELIYAIE